MRKTPTNWAGVAFIAIVAIIAGIVTVCSSCSALPDRVTDKALDQIEFFNEAESVYLTRNSVIVRFDTSKTYYNAANWDIYYLPDGRLHIQYNIPDTLIKIQ